MPGSASHLSCWLQTHSIISFRTLRICGNVLLNLEVVGQFEIGIHVVIHVECFQVADRTARPVIHNRTWIAWTAARAGKDNANTHSHDHGQSSGQNGPTEPMHPSLLRLSDLLTQAGLKAD